MKKDCKLLKLSICVQASRSSKRKGVETISFSESPRLFSSTFKVPKLKNSSLVSRPQAFLFSYEFVVGREYWYSL
ncbi:hypothetical protein HHK36_008649 [Tetracentron sinense]|uniref:Uncharacterized protein n=1 Tax=Tetracentron sinense TaxID=13715 RepID=A0A835DK73_TETSI|nr:hypothetical protein HHK36_008649 [Tetracentron sinense]